MQALILAAGMGKRLGKYTSNNTKCMLKINGKTLIERAIEALVDAGVKKLVLVVGYKGENVKKYLLEECKNPIVKKIEIVFVENPIYDETNNIYSLYLAAEEFKKDDTVLLESDLIYQPELVKRIVEDKDKNLVSVAKYEQWMDGTVVKFCEKSRNITEFLEKKNFNYDEIDKYYKTVNIYKFSKEFINQEFIPFLKAFIEAYGRDEYYELVLKIIAHMSRGDLKALDVSDLKWYEIDDSQDLDIATCLFSEGEEKLANFQKRYGGYWRFDGFLDYCYPKNPYYPTKSLIDKINYFSETLISQYPSNQNINCICASRILNDVDTDSIVVGNGIEELTSILKEDFGDFEIIKGVDNLTGAFTEEKDIMSILDQAKAQNKTVVVDESLVNFAEPEKRYTLIKDSILNEYPNLIVIKSISEAYGVPGIRLGVLASGNKDLIKDIKEKLPAHNINSYGEYFLQIANLYKSDYASSCDKIVEERKRMTEKLEKTLPKTCSIYPSEANFLMIDLEKIDSTKLAVKLLEKDILIKDLKTEPDFKGKNFIRLAIRTEEDNDYLIGQLESILKN